MRNGRRFQALLLVSVLVVFGAACGDDDDGDGGATTTSAGAGGSGGNGAALGEPPTLDPDGRLVPGKCAEGAPTDSDTEHGVTASTINVASVNVDFGPLVNIGFARDQGNTAEQFAAFFKEVNDKGGICGRTLDADTEDFDILKGEAPQMCVKLTDDRRNLVVLGQEGYQEISCVATDGDTVLVTQNNATEEEVGASEGRMFVNPPSWDKQLETTARRFHAAGLLDGKVGVFYGGSNPTEGDIAETALLPVLDELNVDYVDQRTDGLVSDETGAAAARTAVSTFMTEDVETVLLAVQTSNHSGFILEAKNQGLEPKQYLSAPAGGNSANTLFLERSGVFPETEGELLTSYYDISPDVSSPTEESCNEVFTRQTGEKMPPRSFKWWGVVNVCNQVDALVAALTMASPNLTQESIIAAYENLPPHNIGRSIGQVSYGADKRFASSQMIELVFRNECTCYEHNAEPFELS